MKIQIDPDVYAVRCKRCGTLSTMGDMLRRYQDRQRDAPPGMFYVKCPVCSVFEYLRDPNVPTLQPPTPPPPIVRRFMERWLLRRASS